VVGVFDLEAGTAALLHPFTPIGRGGWYFAPVWSPDGRWLVFEVESFDEGERLWVTAVDGSEEVALGRGYRPVFSPDGHYLVLNDEGRTEFPALFEVGSWYRINLWVPGEVVEWR
jgi:Tol biopolymer transport system component